ncbi:MAG: SCO family protein [Acidobacteria bacterium]|nr:SCO family protein [Acidobacteriota bacterium]
MDESNPIYVQQTSQEVTQIRVHALLDLARGPLPEAALPFVLEELDNGMDPHLVAAAAIALRSYSAPSPAFQPFVRRALENISGHDDLISFDTLNPDSSSANVTTPIRELRQTDEWLAAGTTSSGCCPLPPGLGKLFHRLGPSPVVDELILEDQDGVLTTYRDLFTGHPTVVVFFYTRCDNPLKCSLTVWKLARLQKLLSSHESGTRIHTAAISYDSAFDTPARLRRFAANRGLQFSEQHRVLRVQGGIDPLRDHFHLGVNFFDGLVNRHRIELFLLDKQGRTAASCQRAQWDENEICEQAMALLKSAPPSHAWPLARSAAAIFTALLPKCPLCWAAWLSAAGISSITGASVSLGVQIAIAALLLLNLAAVAWRARATGSVLPVLLAAAGSACIVADATLPGTVLIVLGALINSAAMARRTRS